jgi:cytoskeleton protein RodZ
MTDKEEAIKIDATPQVPNVGQRLREARESKNYSIAEVAAQLRLTKETVTALEQQQWEKLHGRAYARGYFASYVKFLGLDEEAMLVAFNFDYRANEPHLNQTSYNTNNSKRFPWMAVIFISLALGITWFAYQQWQQNKDAVADTPTTSWDESYSQPDAAIEDAFEQSVVEPLSATDVKTFEQLNSNKAALNAGAKL